MRRPETIEELWQGYAAMLEIPLHTTQWTETRLAFYSGVWAFLNEQVKAADLPELEGAKYLNDCNRECIIFKERHTRSGL